MPDEKDVAATLRARVTQLREEAEPLLQGITSGEWMAEDIGAGTQAWGVVANDHIVVLHDFVGEQDAKFIAAAPRLIRELLAALLIDTDEETV